jgi:hypothetical protein
MISGVQYLVNKNMKKMGVPPLRGVGRPYDLGLPATRALRAVVRAHPA